MRSPQYSVDSLLHMTDELPVMSEVVRRALTLIRDENSSMAQLASVLSLDQGLTSQVLRWANSASYGLYNPVSTVQQAVVYLGHNAIQSLVLAASVSGYLARPAPGYALELGSLWKHSIGVAAGARLAAQRFGAKLAEEAYHAGLLADMGKLAMELVLRDVDTTTSDWQGRSFADLEVAHFGIDHALVGAEMARRWYLPDRLVEAIAYHHRPGVGRQSALLASAVHVADCAVMMLGVGLGRDGLQYSLDPQACEQLSWTEKDFLQLLDRVGPLIAEAENAMGMMTWKKA